MKYMSIFVLLLMFAVLGCPAREEAADVTESSGQEQVDPAMLDEVLDFKAGEWITDFGQAASYAKNSGLPILLYFTGSDWCPPCIRLKDEVFSKQEFKDYAKESLILLELDFPRDKPQSNEMREANATLRDRFKVTGYPTVILMDGNEQEIARTGYRPGGATAYIAHLKSLLTE